MPQATSSPWPQIGDIIPNHDGDKPQPVADLDGRRFELTGADGNAALSFTAGRAVLRSGEDITEAAVEVFRLREGIYYAALKLADAEKAGTIMLLIDLPMARMLSIALSVPDPHDRRSLLDRIAGDGSQSAVRVEYRSYGLEGQPQSFARTDALVGKHLRYIYSSTHIYEHIYLSERYYSWFCRQGPDQGLGDFEECDYFEVRPDLTLLCWREKLLPCAAVMAEDHAIMRSAGTIFGVDSQSGKSNQTNVGAAMQLLFDDRTLRSPQN